MSELPKLFSFRTETNLDGWSREVPREYSWEELDDTFPPGDGSLVSQLAKHVRAQAATIEQLCRVLEWTMTLHPPSVKEITAAIAAARKEP